VERARAAAAEAQAAADKAREAAKEFAKRLQTKVEKVGEQNEARLIFDGHSILKVSGGKIETLFEGEGAERLMIVKLDGREISRVPLPRFDITPMALPPMAFPNIDAVSTKAVSQTVNGVSTTRVWVDGRLVYDGPGGSSQVSSSNANGVKSVEVKVDGRVVYKACEGQGETPRKDENKD
jgi:hypothetical protein